MVRKILVSGWVKKVKNAGIKNGLSTTTYYYLYRDERQGHEKIIPIIVLSDGVSEKSFTRLVG